MTDRFSDSSVNRQPTLTDCLDDLVRAYHTRQAATIKQAQRAFVSQCSWLAGNAPTQAAEAWRGLLTAVCRFTHALFQCRCFSSPGQCAMGQQAIKSLKQWNRYRKAYSRQVKNTVYEQREPSDISLLLRQIRNVIMVGRESVSTQEYRNKVASLQDFELTVWSGRPDQSQPDSDAGWPR